MAERTNCPGELQRDPLDRDWTAPSLLAFALPTVAMMLSMGVYTAADSAFVSRLVGTDALSAVNIVCPVVNLMVGLGTMLAAGGSAVISRKLGAGELRAAREDLTLLVAAGGLAGVVIALVGGLWLEPLIRALGASPRLLPYCRDYLGALLLFAPASLLQTIFATLFVTAGRPRLGFLLSLLAGAANILLDWLLMGALGMGIRGAAWGTGISYLIPAAAGVFCFARGGGLLRFGPLRWKGTVLAESCLNGSSELVGQLAAAVTTFLFNRTMLTLLGEDGVAAVTILIYAQFLLSTAYIGFSMGVAPVFGFAWGGQDTARLRRVLGICAVTLGAASLGVTGAAVLGREQLVALFAGPGAPVYRLAGEGFGIFAWGFLFCGWNIFVSALFTALSNGRVSAALSLLRTFGLVAGNLLLLPGLWGVTGVWLAVPLAEGTMFLVSCACLARGWRRYFVP